MSEGRAGTLRYGSPLRQAEGPQAHQPSLGHRRGRLLRLAYLRFPHHSSPPFRDSPLPYVIAALSPSFRRKPKSRETLPFPGPATGVGATGRSLLRKTRRMSKGRGKETSLWGRGIPCLKIPLNRHSFPQKRESKGMKTACAKPVPGLNGGMTSKICHRDRLVWNPKQFMGRLTETNFRLKSARTDKRWEGKPMN